MFSTQKSRTLVSVFRNTLKEEYKTGLLRLFENLEKQVQPFKLYSLLETEREALTLREAPISPVAESTDP